MTQTCWPGRPAKTGHVAYVLQGHAIGNPGSLGPGSTLHIAYETGRENVCIIAENNGRTRAGVYVTKSAASTVTEIGLLGGLFSQPHSTLLQRDGCAQQAYDPS